MPRLVPVLGASALAAAASCALAQSTAFTYQGELKSGGQLANGPFDFQFRLFDAGSGGNQLGGIVCLDNVNVVNGRFTALVDFGQQFLTPTPRFLEVQVRADTGLNCSNATGFVALTRQPISAAPLAAHANSAYALDAPTGSPANAVLVDNSGNVGIGTGSPNAGLQVKHEPGTAAGTMALEGVTHTYMTFFPDGFAAGRKGFFGFPGPAINNIELANEIAGGGLALVPGTGGNVEIDGRVGIGMANPTATLQVNGSLGVGVANLPAGLDAELGGTSTPILDMDVNFRQPNHTNASVGGAFRIDSRSDAADPLFQFISRPAGSGTESIIGAVTQTGRMTVGAPFATSFTTLELHGHSVDNRIQFYLDAHSRVGMISWDDQFVIWNGGSTSSAVLQDDGTWSVSSDRRMKTDIVPAEGLLDKALALRPAEFYMKNQDRARDPNKHLGLIAQDVLPVLPSLVYQGDMLRMNYDRIGVVAVGAIQEQHRIILDQKAQIAALRARNDVLAARLDRLEAAIATQAHTDKAEAQR